MMQLDFETDRTFDHDNIENEWLNQTNLVGEYGKALVKAKRRKANIHETLKVTRSELIMECKKDKPKATAAEVEAYYRTDVRHKKAKKALIRAEYEIGLIEVAYDTLRFQKKEAMKEVAKMQRDELFADEASFESEAKRKQVRKKIRRRMKRSDS